MSAAVSRALVFNLQATTLRVSQHREVHTDDRLVAAYQRDPTVRLVVAEPRRYWPAKVVRRIQGEQRPSLTGDTTLYAPSRITRAEPVDVARARGAARRWEHGLRRHLERHGIRHPHVVICNPLLAGFTDLRWAASAVYLTHDDLATGAEYAPWKLAIQSSYEWVRTLRRPMVSVAPVMFDRVRAAGPTLLLPNGVDVDLFTADTEPAAELAHLPRPLAIYAGTLEGRIDRASLEAISRAIGPGTVVLAGQERSPETRAIAAGLANVHFTGHVPPTRVPGFLAAADVGVVPHVVSEVTVGMSPLKLYEYLAAGLPVVATDLPPMRGIDDRVVLCDPGEPFAAGLTEALGKGRAPSAARLAFAREHSWDRRADKLLAFCDEVAAAR